MKGSAKNLAPQPGKDIEMGKIDKDIHHDAAATPFPAPAAMDANTIDQVRELLFGGEKRSTDQRFRDLDDRIEALRADMLARFSMLETRLSDTERALDHQHNVAVDEIGVAIGELGNRVRKLVTAVPRGK